MTTRINQVLESLDSVSDNNDDFCESAELYERRFNLLKEKMPYGMKIENWTKPTDFVNQMSGTEYFTKDEKFAIHIYRGGGMQIQITDITNAMRVGKTCKTVTLDSWQGGSAAIHNFLLDIEEKFGTIEKFMDATTEREDVGEVTITVVEDKAKSTFSPFAAAKLKRLTKLPKKWTLDNLAKVIANGQFSVLKQNYYMGYDEPTDREDLRNARLSPLGELKDIVNKDVEVSRYHDEIEDSHEVRVRYRAHSNDSRTCIVNLQMG